MTAYAIKHWTLVHPWGWESDPRPTANLEGELRITKNRVKINKLGWRVCLYMNNGNKAFIKRVAK